MDNYTPISERKPISHFFNWGMYHKISSRSHLMFLLAIVTLASCEKINRATPKDLMDVSDAHEVEMLMNDVPAPPPRRKPSQDRKMIWTAQLELQVPSVDEASKKIDELCASHNAVVSQMDFLNTTTTLSNRLTIRVDNDSFNDLITAIKGTASYLRRVNISSSDVTEEYLDINSRLQTKKEVRKRYVDILRNRAGEIKDVIAAEDAIRKITEEIEAKEGRLRYLNDRVAQSTIHLELYEKVDIKSPPVTAEKSFGTKAGESFRTGFDIIMKLLLLIFAVWPLLLIAALVFIIVRYRRGRKGSR